MLFESALLESAGRLHTYQRWTALASFTAQTSLVAAMVTASMMFTDALPSRVTEGTSVLPIPPAGGTAQANRTSKPRPARPQPAELTRILQPAWIPTGVRNAVDSQPQPLPPSLGEGGVEGSPGPAATGAPSILNEIARRPMVALPPVPPATRVVRLSRPEPGALTYHVEPRYPRLAIVTRLSGLVVLRATISPEGRIVGLTAVSGPPLLVPAALQAVEQWRYRPYVLNGQAVAVETEIRVNFVLGP